jgi:hypothetical protein
MSDPCSIDGDAAPAEQVDDPQATRCEDKCGMELRDLGMVQRQWAWVGTPDEREYSIDMVSAVLLTPGDS